jgi:chromosome segregation ATPase
MSAETSVNEPHTSRHHGESVFDGPIDASVPRRQLDRRILESYDANNERIRAISSRVTRIEATFDSIRQDMKRLEEHQSKMLGHSEQTAASMAAISHKLAIHTEMEEHQWDIVNSSRDSLLELGTALNRHLQEGAVMSARINWIERLLYLLYGGMATFLGILVASFFKVA